MCDLNSNPEAEAVKEVFQWCVR